MAGSFGRTVRRRVGALVTCALLAAGPAAAPAAGNAASVARPSAGDPGPVSRDAVMRALGVSNVPTEIVILVDISQSMSPAGNGLYPVVRQQVLSYLGVLAQQDPQDLVGIILFGKGTDNQLIDPGPPSRQVWLPEAPKYSNETDFGWAFQQAVQMLGSAPPDIKAGGVVLLSDGELSVPPGDDQTYSTNFTAPGWQQLRNQVMNLPIPVTGYDVPLTSDTSYTGNQYHALSQVFWPVQSLPVGTANLSRALDLATQGVLDSEVAKAAAPDGGAGIRVASSGLREADGEPVDLATGQAEITVTATATTRKIPVYLSGLSVASAGLPVDMKGSVPGGRLLAPGQSASWQIRLTWHPTRSGWTWLGGPRPVHGKLRLAATVSSPFTPTLHSAFADTSFSLGGYQSRLDPPFRASEPAHSLLLALLVLLVLAVLLVAVARTWLSGTLTVTPEGRTPYKARLSGWWLFRSTAGLDGSRGRLLVYRSPVRRLMKVHMWIHERRPYHETLHRGKTLMPAGFHVVHEPRRRRFRTAAAGQTAPAPPDQADDQQEHDGQETGS